MSRPINIVLYCMLLGLILGSLGYGYDLNDRKAALKKATAMRLKVTLENGLDGYRQFNQNAVQHAVFFSSVPLLKRVLKEAEPVAVERIAGFVERFARLYSRYSQIRVLDVNGFEVIRFDRAPGSYDEVVRTQVLQDKSGRDYFHRAKALTSRSAYVGALTPNIENGELVVPHDANFRVLAPIDTEDGERLGYFVLNARAGDFLIDVARDLLPAISNYAFILHNDRLGTWRLVNEQWDYSPTVVKNDLSSDTVSFAGTLGDNGVSGSGQEANLSGRIGLARLEARSDFNVVTDFSETINFRVEIPADVWSAYEARVVDSQNWRRFLTIVLRAEFASLLVAIATILYLKQEKRKKKRRELVQLKLETDHLTGVLSRNGLEDRLARYGGSNAQSRPSLSLCVLDIDHFKAINDQYGHSTGDAVLVQLAKLLRKELRDTDLFARWGGEEFLIVLNGVSPQVAFKVVERYRRVVEQFTFKGEAGVTLKITTSMGVAMFNSGSFEDAFNAADKALYKAKNSGRNQVCVHEQDALEPTISLGDTLPNLEVLSDRGKFRLLEYVGTSWLILFSHPKDFTPVCTTELAVVAKRAKDWQARNTKVMALSVDGLDSHQQWKNDIASLAGCAVDYLLISDSDLRLAKLLDMLPEDAYLANDCTVEEAQTIRGVFIFSPDAKLQASLLYPMSVGRNFDDIMRLLDALQARWRDAA